MATMTRDEAEHSKANLNRADLSGAYLYGADLSGAYLNRANLSGAYLYGANLYGANLSGANLSGADLYGANLYGANLSGADLGPRSIVPETGSFVGWKRLRDGVICEIFIPANAGRTSSYVGRKCRAELVIVLSGTGSSTYDSKVGYTPGLTVRPDSYDPDPRVECSHGIHFFLTRKEAEDYTP